MTELGKAIKLARVRKGLEALEVASRADINPKYYYKIERGENNPSIGLLAKVAAALDTPLWEIIKEAEELDKGDVLND